MAVVPRKPSHEFPRGIRIPSGTPDRLSLAVDDDEADGSEDPHVKSDRRGFWFDPVEGTSGIVDGDGDDAFEFQDLRFSPRLVPDGKRLVVPYSRQLLVHGQITIQGQLDLSRNGHLVVI